MGKDRTKELGEKTSKTGRASEQKDRSPHQKHQYPVVLLVRPGRKSRMACFCHTPHLVEQPSLVEKTK